MSGRPLRTVVVDDHPAIRAGVRAVLDPVADIEHVGEAAGEQELGALLDTARADVVLLDLHLPDEDGLVACLRVKCRPRPPRVVLYSAYADPALVAPAHLAQADALLAKSASAEVLCDAIRDVAERDGPPPPPAAERERLLEALGPEEVALAGLLLMRVPPDEAARTLGEDPAELVLRTEAVLRRLSAAARG